MPFERLGLATAARDIAYVLKDETLRAKLFSLSIIATERWHELFHQKVSAVYRAVPSIDRQ
jgi:hypothetical protein